MGSAQSVGLSVCLPGCNVVFRAYRCENWTDLRQIETENDQRPIPHITEFV